MNDIPLPPVVIVDVDATVSDEVRRRLVGRVSARLFAHYHGFELGSQNSHSLWLRTRECERQRWDEMAQAVIDVLPEDQRWASGS